ncbi:MAG TPA: sulfite exporter TauE/SafE family protein [Mariprofundaceae bacterium]|nr:sulfite exporter TauE/SafE family protein [Mariprofundaceae bacterium]
MLPMTLALMLSMGFLGSFHCIGMCGGLVSVLSMSREQVWWSGLLAYQAGRISTYAALGLLVGVSGAALSAFGGDQVQRLLAVLAGFLMIVFSLNLAGWLPDPLRRLGAWAGRKTGIAQLARRVAGNAGIAGWYSFGLVNGLLPCGLVYAALSLALASGNAASATVMMVGFGLGTVPAMMFVPTVFRRMTPFLRLTSLRIAAAMIMALGLITIYRGLMHFHSMHGVMH